MEEDAADDVIGGADETAFLPGMSVSTSGLYSFITKCVQTASSTLCGVHSPPKNQRSLSDNLFADKKNRFKYLEESEFLKSMTQVRFNYLM